MEGRVKMRFANGNIYDGEWLNGQANGIGEITDVNNNTLIGKFTNGTISGYARLKDQNGYSYRQYDDQGLLINNNIPKDTIEYKKRYYVGYDYL